MFLRKIQQDFINRTAKLSQNDFELTMTFHKNVTKITDNFKNKLKQANIKAQQT